MIYQHCISTAYCPVCLLLRFVCQFHRLGSWQCDFLAALAALYLTLVSQWVSDCHFRILTQRVTFETSDPSDI